MELTDGTNVLQWLEESARRDPDKIAFADESEEITYSELLFQAQSVGTALASSGVLREAVAVLLPRGIGQVVSIFGVAESGGCYAILDSGSPQDRLAAIVSSFRPLSLLVCDETAELGERLLPGRCLRIEDARRVPADLALLADIRRASRPDDLLYVLYTSGSTGTPKGVMVSHANVISYVGWFARCFGIDSETIFGKRVFIPAEVVHDYYLFCVSTMRMKLCMRIEHDMPELRGAEPDEIRAQTIEYVKNQTQRFMGKLRATMRSMYNKDAFVEQVNAQTEKRKRREAGERLSKQQLPFQ